MMSMLVRSSNSTLPRSEIEPRVFEQLGDVLGGRVVEADARGLQIRRLLAGPLLLDLFLKLLGPRLARQHAQHRALELVGQLAAT